MSPLLFNIYTNDQPLDDETHGFYDTAQSKPQWRKPWPTKHITTEQTFFKGILARQKLLSSSSNDSRLHVVESPSERSFIWEIGVNSSIQDRRQVDRVFFMESSQLYAATLTHYSTGPLTTGPDYDPLLLLLALAGDVHPNPGPSRYPCSVCFKNVTSQGTSYLCTRC